VLFLDALERNLPGMVATAVNRTMPRPLARELHVEQLRQGKIGARIAILVISAGLEGGRTEPPRAAKASICKAARRSSGAMFDNTSVE